MKKMKWKRLAAFVLAAMLFAGAVPLTMPVQTYASEVSVYSDKIQRGKTGKSLTVSFTIQNQSGSDIKDAKIAFDTSGGEIWDEDEEDRQYGYSFPFEDAPSSCQLLRGHPQRRFARLVFHRRVAGSVRLRHRRLDLLGTCENHSRREACLHTRQPPFHHQLRLDPPERVKRPLPARNRQFQPPADYPSASRTRMGHATRSS